MPTLYETSSLCLLAESGHIENKLSWRVFEDFRESNHSVKCFYSEQQSIVAVVHLQERAAVNKQNIDETFKYVRSIIEFLRQDAFLQYKIVHIGYLSAGVYAQLCGYYFGHATHVFENPAWKQYIELLPDSGSSCLIKQYSILSYVNTVGQLGNVLLINNRNRESSRNIFQFFSSSEASSISLENIVKLFEKIPSFDPATNDQLPDFLTEDFCFIEDTNRAEDNVNIVPGIQTFIPPGNEDLIDHDDRSFFLHNADNPIIYYQCESRMHPGYILDQKHWLISHVSALGKFPGHSMIVIEGVKPPLSVTEQPKLFVGYFHLIVDRNSGLSKILGHESETYRKDYAIHQAVSWRCERVSALNFVRKLEQEKSDAIKYQLLANTEHIGGTENVQHNCATWVLEMLEKHAGIPNPRISWNHVVAKPIKNAKEKNQAEHPDLVQTQWSPFSSCVIA